MPWRELGNGLLFPCSSRRSGFGPCQRLTCPTYFGEAVGSELQHDVLVAIMGFIHGIEAEAHDIGVCSDPPPPWLRDEKEKVSESKDALTTDRLNWEAFLDDLGLKPLSPCTSHRKVAGTILTIDLGWRLSSSDWWKAAAASKAALAYLEPRTALSRACSVNYIAEFMVKSFHVSVCAYVRLHTPVSVSLCMHALQKFRSMFYPPRSVG